MTLKKDRGSKLLFANQDRIEKTLREIRKEAMESKKQTPDQTAFTLKAGSRLRSRLKGARQEIAKYSKDMPADTKARYMENVRKLSRMLEGQPTSPNNKTEYKSDSTPKNMVGQTYKAGATKLGRKETTGDRYSRVQGNLLNKKKDKMAGKDPGESKFNKGGTVKTYSAGGVTGGADMKVIAKEKETHTKYNEKPSKDYGKPKKLAKKPVKKNAGGMIKAYKKGGSVDGVALRGRTKVKRVKG